MGQSKVVASTFEELVEAEQEVLGGTGASMNEVEVSPPGPAGEPRVTFSPEDRVGLALSGGGIRSATFNLGLLQALNGLGILQHVDYLSTVSGGGYIGGWWTSWRASFFPETQGNRHFPNAAQWDDGTNEGPEPGQVRHLREFSNFLSPRLGFFEAETWSIVVTLITRLVPSLLTAIATTVLVLVYWRYLAFLCLASPLGYSPVVLAVLTGVALAIAEWWWCRKRKARPEDRGNWAVVVWSIVAALVTWPGYGALYGFVTRPEAQGEYFRVFARSEWVWHQNSVLWLMPALIWLLEGAVFVVIWTVAHLGGPRLKPANMAAFERVLGRLFCLAASWAVLGGIWELGQWIHSGDLIAILSGTAVTAGTGGLFAWLLKRGSTRLFRTLATLPPQILAYLALVVASALVVAMLSWVFLSKGVFFYWLTYAGVLSVIAVALCIDWTTVGLHGFYRSRLARAYLGAFRDLTERDPNRETSERRDDDVCLSETGFRPLHLVCCAANDLSGDPVATLGRGARSGVLSCHGLSIGPKWFRLKDLSPSDLTLSAAVTASAAAFNSNMGSMSVKLGSAVRVLMSALNLRLGLWVSWPHDKERRTLFRQMPDLTKSPWKHLTLFLREILGIVKALWNHPRPFLQEMLSRTRLLFKRRTLFFREMLGQTKSTLGPKPTDIEVHLSDGGHFENLALYELVRRHCRFIIVSDCGADPDLAFDDFGNAVRRIREDFGVEIELDLTPLRLVKPAEPGRDELSRQHMVVGTIHYDQHYDRGILLYFKPTLTGDEPGDVLQYETRNRVFPHETTGDQFYDEAQWESYRRLGEHAARSALRFVEGMREPGPVVEHPPGPGPKPPPGPGPEAIFSRARDEWYPTPPDYSQSFLDLTDRCARVEGEIRDSGLLALQYEFFPELNAVTPMPDGSAERKSEDWAKTLYYMLLVAQIMEDTWVGCHLETHPNLPLNLGWMNYLRRWANTPTFRMWWPVLKPLYSPGFGRFAEERLGLPKATFGGHLREDEDTELLLLATEAWKRERDAQEATQPDKEAKRDARKTTKYEYVIELHYKDRPYPIQAGLAFVESVGDEAHWCSNDFFVPASLWGAGIGGAFLKALTGHLHRVCRVTLQPKKGSDEPTTDPASRQELTDLISFYKRAGFVLAEDRTTMVKRLG